MDAVEQHKVLDTWQAALKSRGYRVTRPRQQVMEIILSSQIPLTPQEIFQASLGLEEPPGIASIYRTLETLAGLGLIQQIHQPQGCHKIWAALDGHKHYLICKDCGHMRVIEGSDQMAGFISRIEDQTGYRVDEHWLQFFGVCQDCGQ